MIKVIQSTLGLEALDASVVARTRNLKLCLMRNKKISRATEMITSSFQLLK